MVEHHVANVIVAGSIPVTRSIFFALKGISAGYRSISRAFKNPQPAGSIGPAMILLLVPGNHIGDVEGAPGKNNAGDI